MSCAAAACALLAAGCGSAAGATAGSARPAAGQPAAPCPACVSVDPGGPIDAGPSTAAWVSLDVTIYPGQGGKPYGFTLRCEPDGGTAPDPAAACAELLANPGLLEPQPVGHVIACPMIMASSGRAVVDGTYRGRPVHETIVDGGCDLQRWAELLQIFGSTNSHLQPVNPGYPVVPGRS